MKLSCGINALSITLPVSLFISFAVDLTHLRSVYDTSSRQMGEPAQRSVTTFLWKEGFLPQNIPDSLPAVHGAGEKTLSLRTAPDRQFGR
jgi:hypothetical protein